MVFASTVRSKFAPSVYFLLHQHANVMNNINKLQRSSSSLLITRTVSSVLHSVIAASTDYSGKENNFFFICVFGFICPLLCPSFITHWGKNSTSELQENKAYSPAFVSAMCVCGFFFVVVFCF